MSYFGAPDSSPITTAEQAITIGDRFLSRFSYLVKRPLSARQEEDRWEVTFDVSVIGPKQIIRLEIDSESGAITEFSTEGIA